MDLVSMVVNNKGPMEVIILTYFEIESTVMGCHVYRNNWEPTVADWDSVSRVVTQTRGWAFQTLGRAFDFRLRLQKLGRAFERLDWVF